MNPSLGRQSLVRHGTTGHDFGENGRYQHRRHFSISHSTEDRCRSLDDEGFYGAYGHIRKKLDYSYHQHYRKERQWLHDSIIEAYLQNGAYADPNCLPHQPWLILTVGCQGAGKRFTIDTLVKSNRLPLLSFVCVDVDEIRQLLPEYSSYLKEAPVLLEHLTRKECGYIAETLTLAALQTGGNVILDSCLKDIEWYIQHVRDLRKAFPKLKIALFHITAELDRIMMNSNTRALVTGRSIPKEVVARTLSYIPTAVDNLKSQMDYFCTIFNGGNELQLDADGGWDCFCRMFEQIDSLALVLPKVTSLARDSTLSVDVKNSGFIQKDGIQPRRFRVLLSTEENYKVDDRKFYGQFAHIRKMLDYTYHSNYTFERQIFQDSIINELLHETIVKDPHGGECSTPTEPWIVFTAGAMGAGKSFTMTKLAERGLFPLHAFVRADPDEIRRYMPEYCLYNEQNPEQAGQLTRKESGLITEILTLAGLQAGKNVLVDGSLRDSTWYKYYFNQLRVNHPDIRLALVHVTATPEAVFQRAAERGVITGRVVPREILSIALEQVPKSVEKLKNLVDYFIELHNSIDISIVHPEEESWESFKDTWTQTCAWMPSKARLMKKSSKLPSIASISSSIYSMDSAATEEKS